MASASNYITAFAPAGGCIDGGRVRQLHNRLPSFPSNPPNNLKRFIHITAAAKKGAGEASSVGAPLFKFGIKKNEDEEEEDEDEEEGEEEKNPFSQVIEALKKLNEGGSVKGGGLVPIADVLGSRMSVGATKRRDPKTVFVAGANGQIGARIVQKLLRQGLSVRGGIRDLFVAQQLAEFASQYGVISREEAKRLNAVEFDYKSVESIAKAIGIASQVVVTIGPTEDGPKSNVSFEDASNVIEAAKLANITNIVVVYEPVGSTLGNGDVTIEKSLAGIASFFTGLFNKPEVVLLSELLDEIVDSDMRYTLIKTAPTDGVDDFSQQIIGLQKLELGSSSIVGSDTKISKAQVAEVVAEVLLSPGSAENKVIEVFVSASAEEQRPISELLSGVLVDGRRAELLEAREKAEKEVRERAEREEAEAEARAAVEEARRASQLAAQLEAEAKRLGAEEARLNNVAAKAQARAASAAASIDGLAAKIKDLAGNSPTLPNYSNVFARLTEFPSTVSGTSTNNEKPQPTLSTKARKPKAVKTKSTTSSPSSTPATPAVSSKPQVNSIFGGLFTQETVYVDEV